MSSHRSSQRPCEELPSTPYGDLVPAREDLQLALKDKARRIMRKAHLPEAQVAGLSQPDIFIHLAGLSEPIRGTLRGLFKGTLHVASSQSIIPSLNVTVTFGDAAIRGSVAYCISKGSHYLVSIAVSPLTEARRRDFRLPCHKQCSIVVLGPGSLVRCEGVITDISVSGMGVRVSRRIAVGNMICAQAEGVVAAGQVLRCHSLGDAEYAVGIEITDILWGEKKSVGSWSERVGDWWRRYRRQIVP